MKRSLRRTIFIPLLGLALLLATSSGRAQQYLPDYALHGIDSAMSAILMKRSDMAMRWDAVPDDIHRLSVIKNLFGDPLRSFTVANNTAIALSKGAADPIPMFRHICSLLDMTDVSFGTTRPMMTDEEIRLFTKIDLGRLDFESGQILRRFLALALATDANINSNRSAIPPEQFARLVDYADSLVIQSEDDANATLVQLKAAERYGLARSKQFFNVDAPSLSYGRLVEPGITMYAAALDLARKINQDLPRFRDSIKTRIFETPMGRVAIGGPGDDVYTGEFFCIIDVGGNDVYKLTPRSKAQAIDRPVAIIVDFAGNDTYIAGNYALGGTLFGASVLIDLAGDDDYSANNFSLGCGYFGVGVLYDGGGNDRYSGAANVEGAGLFGIGLLIDEKGNDTYRAHIQSQGFGYTRGFGAIIERAGNDNYTAASPYIDYLRYDDHYETFCQGAGLGSRPVASGGIGIIADDAGNDNYAADIYGQGTAYWFALGAIVDRGGNDNYSAYQYAQGTGVHLAFGVLIDENGDDNYVSHGVSQGCGHDIGFGGLYDADGNDNYVIESLSIGGGNANAVSLFIDGGGEDGYIARRTNTMGYSDLRREYGMIGIFLDLEGRDFYGTVRGGNDSLWTGSYYGVGLDGVLRPPRKKDAATGPTQESKKSDKEIEAELAKDIPTLFIQASAAPQKYQYIVEPARNKLVERADESLPYLLDQFNSESPRERLALGIIIPKIGKRVTPRLIDTVRHGDRSRIGMAIYILGEMHDSTAAAAIGERLVDSASWRLRSSSGEALLKMRAEKALPYVRRALHDTVDLVRGYAARIFALSAPEPELGTLLPMLDDPSQIVRYQIQLALQKRTPDSMPAFFIHAMLAAKSGYPRQLLYGVAVGLKDESVRERLLDSMLKNPNPAVRADGVRLAMAWDSKPLMARTLKVLKKKEKEPSVMKILSTVPGFRRTKRQNNGDKAETDGGGVRQR